MKARRFLSLRDKSGAHRRSRSVPAGNKARPLGSESLRNLFKTDPTRQAVGDAEDAQAVRIRVKEVQHRLDELNITNVGVDHIRDIMATDFANGDAGRTAEFIDLEQKSTSGLIVPYSPRTHMVGAENRAFVTCYLDSLLFAMFAKLDAFECMLKIDFPPNDSRHRLVNLLRIWVNMLRTGKLIRTDFTELIQNALADCGWSDARYLEQQDTSEAFAFLTETLRLPLLSLKVDLFHHGRGDKDDHKVVYERLLNLAVPPDPEGKGIRLEDCLEEYFNAQVDVLRDSEVAKNAGMDEKLAELAPLRLHRNSFRMSAGETGEQSTPTTSSPITINSPAVTMTSVEGTSQPETSVSVTPVDTSQKQSQDASSTEGIDRRASTRARSVSVIQNVLVDGRGRASSTAHPATLEKDGRKGSVVVKAVTIPAWQFFRLIPWHSVSGSEPQNDTDVAINFDQRPVVGICLKRYAMSESGQPQRHNTYIDIPDSLRLPRFMLADDSDVEEQISGLNTDYKLVLQSVICHRGDSVQSGHYISFARVAPRLLRDSSRGDFDLPPGYEEAQWVRFDDLDIDNRVTYVDDIKKCLREEMPYLLFYQVVPMVEVAYRSTEDAEPKLPSYTEASINVEQPTTPDPVDVDSTKFAGHTENHHEPLPSPELGRLSGSKPFNSRRSMEIDHSYRRSIDDIRPKSISGYLGGDSRRQSVTLTDSAVVSPAITPERQSPLVGPSDESTASRLSRAASRFARGRSSRPPSQSGEGRISFSMGRFGGLRRQSKEKLAEPPVLNISAVDSTGPPTTDVSIETVELPAESEKPLLQAQPGQHKHIHKRGKSKDKVGREKASSQPERECTVM